MAKDAPSIKASLYYYTPSIPIAVAGALLFICVATIYLWLLIRYRAWHFWAMYIGLFMECVGFTARLISVRNPSYAGPFVISYLALLLAPSFMAAACYATFGRLLWWITPVEDQTVRTLWCPARFVTPLFISFDLGSCFIQLLGAGAVGTAYANKSMSTKDRQDKIQSGVATLKLGFSLQLICFGLFVFIGARFLYVSRRWAGKPLRYSAPSQPNWTRLNWAINAATLAITVRAGYRMAEFGSSSQSPGYLLRHEWPFWVFDALPMIGVFVLFALAYPGRHLPRELCSWWLNTRQLRNMAQSLPPCYNQATSHHVMEQGTEQNRNNTQQVWI